MSRDDFYDSPLGSAYSMYMERPGVSRVVAGLVWGGSTAPYYRSMSAIGEVDDGVTIVDCPCGAGPAFRALDRGKPVRYVAADLSPAMLRRARSRAAARGLDQIELVQADATGIPLEDSSADLFLSFWGLHCFPDPRAALVEAARVLRPGGRLVGATFVRGKDTLRQRLIVRPNTGDFGPIGSDPETREWLGEAGFALSRSQRSGPMLFFDGRLAG